MRNSADPKPHKLARASTIRQAIARTRRQIVADPENAAAERDRLAILESLLRYAR